MSTRATEATRAESQAEHEAGLQALLHYFAEVHAWLTDEDGLPTAAPRSALAADDAATDPYQMSHAIAHSWGVGLDHLHCLRAAIQEAGSIHTFAPYTLLRGAIEAFATACYLLGPEEHDERVRRRLKLAVRNAGEADQVEGVRTPRGASDRVQKVKDVAARSANIDPNDIAGTSHGYLSIVSKGGEACAVGADLAVLAYRASSGLAHGQQWATFSLLDIDQVQELTDDVLQARITAATSKVATVMAIALIFAKEARRLLTLRAAPPQPSRAARLLSYAQRPGRSCSLGNPVGAH